MQELFVLTRDGLLEIANATGLSYKEINVLLWYFAIPLTWAFLLDLILGKHVVKLAALAVGAVVLIGLYRFDSVEWLFDLSCEFLLASDVGGNYVNASVIICLFVPVLIYIVLIPWAFVAFIRRRRSSAVQNKKEE